MGQLSSEQNTWRIGKECSRKLACGYVDMNVQPFMVFFPKIGFLGHLNIIDHSGLIPKAPEVQRRFHPLSGVTGQLHGQWMGTVNRRFEGQEDSEVSRFLAPFLWPFDHGKCEGNLICGKLPDLEHKPFLFLKYACVYTQTHKHIHAQTHTNIIP